VKRLLHVEVVQMKVVSVTDVHDVDAELHCDTPGEDCDLGAVLGRTGSGFEQLNTGERAPAWTINALWTITDNDKLKNIHHQSVKISHALVSVLSTLNRQYKSQSVVTNQEKLELQYSAIHL